MKNRHWKIYGNEKPEILVAGHSHVFPLYMAVQRRHSYKKTFGVVSQSDFSKPLERDSSYWDFVVASSKKCKTAIIWNGNQHNFHFLIDTNEPFKVFGLINENLDVPVVSKQRLKNLFSPTFNELRTVIKRFDSSSRLLLVGTPPPKPKVFIDKKINHDPFFLNLAKQVGLSGVPIQATPDEMRIAMWKFTQDLTKEVAAEFGHKFIEVPSSAIDENGLLKAEFWTEDISHANEEFGALVMDTISITQGTRNE